MVLTVYTTISGFVDRGDTRWSIYAAFSWPYPDTISAIEGAQYLMCVTQTLIADVFMVSLPWPQIS